jgi:hypothetical protein
MLTALGCGLRLAELSHLQWADVDLQLGKGRVRATAKAAGEFEVDGKTYPILPWESKSRHNRAVPTEGNRPPSDPPAFKRRREGCRSGRSTRFAIP